MTASHDPSYCKALMDAAHNHVTWLSLGSGVAEINGDPAKLAARIRAHRIGYRQRNRDADPITTTIFIIGMTIIVGAVTVIGLSLIWGALQFAGRVIS